MKLHKNNIFFETICISTENMIKGLDDDEVEFLDLVDRTKLEEERKKNLEEEKEMREFKAKVASLQEQKLNEKLKQELKNPSVSSKHAISGRYIALLMYV